jgi:hypothetical protein
MKHTEETIDQFYADLAQKLGMKLGAEGNVIELSVQEMEEIAQDLLAEDSGIDITKEMQFVAGLASEYDFKIKETNYGYLIQTL